MKLMLFTVLMSLPLLAQAQCPTTDQLVQQIKSSPSCYEAVELAEECAMGSSVDAVIAGSAQMVCDLERGPLPTSDSAYYSSLLEKCNDKYADQTGTMYISFAAFCRLEVAVAFNSVFAPIAE